MAKRQNGKGKLEASWVQRHEMLLMFILMVVSLIVLAVFIIPDILSPAIETGPYDDGSNLSVSVISANGKTIDTMTCLAGNGITDVSLVYIYSDSCSYSNANTPWVMALPSKGYGVFFVNAANASAMAAATSCLRDIADFTGTPEYICLRTKQSRLGAFSSETDLNNFAAACR